MTSFSRSPSPPMLPPPPPPDVIAAMSAASNCHDSDFATTTTTKRNKAIIVTRKNNNRKQMPTSMTMSSSPSSASKSFMGTPPSKDRGIPVTRHESPNSKNLAKVPLRRMSPPVQRPSQLPVVSSYNYEAPDSRSEVTKGRVAGVKRSKISPGRSPKRMATSRQTGAGGQNRSRSPSETFSRQSSPEICVSRCVTGRLEHQRRRCRDEEESAVRISAGLLQLQHLQLFLLHKIPDQHLFVVAQSSLENVFKVQIGPQICSCGQRDDVCVHLLFVLLRVFKLPQTDHRVPAFNLTQNEVEELFLNLETSTFEDATNPVDDVIICPVCFIRIEDDENLSARCPGPRGCLFHRNCFTILNEDREKNRTESRPNCPSCGVIWGRESCSSSSVPLNFSNPHQPIHHRSQQTLVATKSSPGSTPLNDLWHDPFAHRDPVALPVSAPIPQQHWTVASAWIPVFGRDLVACFFSRDWELREAALHRLAFELSGVFRPWQEPANQGQDLNVERVIRLWRCAAEILTRAMDDKVYKVYLAAVKSLHTLIVSTREAAESAEDKSWLRPILQSIFLKCSDANRRISQLSLITMMEFAKGSSGELRLGKENSSNLDGIDFVLQTLLIDDREPFGKSWQSALGRLVVLDSLLRDFSTEFSFDNLSCRQFERTMLALEFGFRHLASTHTNVGKMARKVFVAAAKVSSSDRGTYDQVLRLISTLDQNLQVRMKRRLSKTSATNEQVALTDDNLLGRFLRDGFQPPTTSGSDRKWTRPPLMRSTSHSPSRTGSVNPMRSGSQSPSRKQQHQQQTSSTTTKRSTSTSNRTSQNVKKSRSVFKIYSKPSKYNLSNIEENSREWNFLESDLFDYDDCDQAVYLRRDKENWLRQSVEDLEEDHHLQQSPLPIIDGLSWPNLDEQASAHEPITEQLPYLEGSHWTRGSLLGTGAYSNCYQARDIGSGTLMAVKQINIFRGSEAEQDRVEQLVREEVKLMSSLNHRHIVRMFGAVQEGSAVNLFIEWMAGGSVANLLDKHGAFAESVILRYTHQILLGLHYLHSFGILHRDLKGANLLVDTTGQHLRIGDFGAAAMLSSSTAVTMPGEFQGQLQGTIAFMAPEVLRGEDYGRTCDIWSLGCCIIEMSTTKPPWNASDISNSLALIFKIACSQGPPSLPSHLSPELSDFCLRCLELSPDHRPSAEDLLLYHPAMQN